MKYFVQVTTQVTRDIVCEAPSMVEAVQLALSHCKVWIPFDSNDMLIEKEPKDKKFINMVVELAL